MVVGTDNVQTPHTVKTLAAPFDDFILLEKCDGSLSIPEESLKKLKKMFISWAEYILKYQKRDIAKSLDVGKDHKFLWNLLPLRHFFPAAAGV